AGRYPVAAAGGIGERAVPGRGQEARAALASGRDRHAKARRPTVAHRPPAPAGGPGPRGRGREGAGRQEVTAAIPPIFPGLPLTAKVALTPGPCGRKRTPGGSPACRPGTPSRPATFATRPLSARRSPPAGPR